MKKKQSKRTDAVKLILADLKKHFISSFPKLENNYIPEPPTRKNVKDFDELKPHLKSYSNYMNEVDNFGLKNSCLFGRWLTLAYSVYRYEKFVLGNDALPKNFETWVRNNCNISKTLSYNYRKFSKLVERAPKLVHCRVGLRYFVKRHNVLLTYFKNNESPWVHKHSCSCSVCKKYLAYLKHDTNIQHDGSLAI